MEWSHGLAAFEAAASWALDFFRASSSLSYAWSGSLGSCSYQRWRTHGQAVRTGLFRRVSVLSLKDAWPIPATTEACAPCSCSQASKPVAFGAPAQLKTAACYVLAGSAWYHRKSKGPSSSPPASYPRAEQTYSVRSNVG